MAANGLIQELNQVDGIWINNLRRRASRSEGHWPTGAEKAFHNGYARLTNVTSAAGSFGYQYDSQRPTRIAQLDLPNGHRIENHYDDLARLTGSTLISSNGAIHNAHGYQLNVGHQRTNQVFTNATLSLAGERMGYTYDNIGQLKTATGKLADGSTGPRVRLM